MPKAQAENQRSADRRSLEPDPALTPGGESGDQTVAPWLIHCLKEDIGRGDVTSYAVIPVETQAIGKLVARESLIVCGTEQMRQIFTHLDPKANITIHAKDGTRAEAGQPILTTQGQARAMLAAERTALNLLQRMCGVATLTRTYVDEIAGTGAKILDTRKTMPGLRPLDKLATLTGGAVNHRMGLHDMVLIKDNHIALAGGIESALTQAMTYAPEGIPIQVECDTLEQLKQVLALGVTMVLLDNMTLAELREAVAINQGRAVLEASGGITLTNVRAIAETGVQRISIGALTHSAVAVDIGLDIEKA